MKLRRPNQVLLLAAGALALLAVPSLHANDVIKQQMQFYQEKILPVLTDKCFRCHSGGGDKAKGGLMLDTRPAMLRGGDTAPAVVPGMPEKSLLVKAIAYADEDLQMPPKERLPGNVIADMVVWIKMGAPVPQDGKLAKSAFSQAALDHWAFQKVTKPAIPEVQGKQWENNAVDAFILAKQEAKKIYPNQRADKRTLIRRATFDLIGLPPTPQEIDDFLADNSPKAFEKVVDRLLASPQYGERWGRYWLDVARYADTKGDVNARREDPHYPYAYTYRDYVIKAFNDDMPYNEFIMEQLAADIIKPKDAHAQAALGFLTVGNRFNNAANEIINDRIDVVTKGFQALTVTCARCHDHKFDPIPTEDYYSLHGVFSSCMEPKEEPLIDKPEKTPQYLDYLKQHAKLEGDLQEYYRKDVGGFLADFRMHSAAYLTILQETKGKDRSVIGQYTRKNKLVLEAARLWQTVLSRTRRGYDPIMGPYHEFERLSDKDFASKARDIARRIADNSDRKRPINPVIANQFRGITPTSMSHVASIYGRALSAVEARWQDTIKRNPSADKLSDPYQEAVRILPYVVAGKGTDPNEALRRVLPQKMQRREVALIGKINELEGSHPGAPERAMVINDKPNPKDSYVFIRGEANSRGSVVPRRYLEIISGPNRKPFEEGSGRLEMAKAIASKDNPLTARVMVNRIWMHHFGDGFVLTPDDFGTQSSPPSHPELLDYLSSWFMDNGWSIKKLHRLIMLSYTYQLSSENNPQFAQLDPYNRLLWRANIRRLEFEALRDSLLAIGGKLDNTMGGKPVDLMDEPYSTRRTVYGYIDRAKVPEVMNNFDFANPDIVSGRRYETIVPQQALFMMNSPLVVEQARNLVQRPDFKALSDDVERIKLLYDLIFQRLPSETEIKLGEGFLNTTPESDLVPVVAPVQQLAQAKGKGKNRRPTAAAAKPSQKPLSAWEKYAHALLQTNEACFVN